MTQVKIRDLSRQVGSSLRLGEERGARIIDAFVAALKGAIASGRVVEFPGFGQFSITQKDDTPWPTAVRANFVSEFGARLSEADPAKVQSMIGSFLDVVKNEIMAGHRVALEDVGVLEVRYEKPKIEQHPTGHRLIRPAMTALVFTPNKLILTFEGEAKLVFTPADEIRKRVEQVRSSAILLLVRSVDYFSKTLEYYFRTANWDIDVLTDVPSAMKRMESGKPYLAIVDGTVADHQKFCTGLKLKKETTNTPLILLYENAAAYDMPAELMVTGDENLPQPFEFRNLLELADSEIVRAAEEELIFKQQINLQLPTDEAQIERTIEMVHRLLEGSELDEQGQVALAAAFREAVVNAAQHGNKYRKDRPIEIQYLLDTEKITMVVTDQGTGFNHDQHVRSVASRDAISAARGRHLQGRMGGLGIMMILKCCERVEYNTQGNQVTLTKYLRPQAQAQSAAQAQTA